MSQGKAIGAGTRGTLSYNCHDMANPGVQYEVDIKGED